MADASDTRLEHSRDAKHGTENKIHEKPSGEEARRGRFLKSPFGADVIAAFVDRVPHSCMSYEENLKRISRKFAVHSPVQYDQIFIDGYPVGHPMMTEKAKEILCWLAWSLQDLEGILGTASRDAESSRKPQ